MKPEVSEKLFVEELFHKSIREHKISPISDDYDVDKLTGDASTRRYYRVASEKVSYVVCLDQPQDTDIEKSHPFVEVHSAFRENGVRVPEIYDVELDRGYFLEEDLGDLTLLSKLGRITSLKDELTLYYQALEELVEIHQIPQDTYRGKSLTNLSFDEEKLMSEVELSLEYLVKGYLAPQGNSQLVQTIRNEFKMICRELAARKKVICHRDFHSRNIMVPDSGEFVIIDFQDARLGVPQYDLSSLLEDCYYRLAPENKEKLLYSYWEKSQASQKLYSSYESFYADYLLSASQRLFKALGSFAYIYHKRGDIRYLKYISYGFENLRDKLRMLPQHEKLLLALNEVYYGP